MNHRGEVNPYKGLLGLVYMKIIAYAEEKPTKFPNLVHCLANSCLISDHLMCMTNCLVKLHENSHNFTDT